MKLQKAKEWSYLQDYHKIESRIATANGKQIEAAEAFRTGDYRIVCMIGANQSGKTVACGEMSFARHLRDDAKPNTIFWCVAPSQERSVSKQQQVLWDILPRWMFGDQAFDPKNGFGSVRPTVVLEPEGRKIIVRFKSAAQYDSDPRAFESEAVDGIWVDESIEEYHFDSMLPRCIAKRGFMLISTIPDVPWMHERLAEAPPEAKVKFIKLSIMDNAENLPPGAIEEMKSQMTEDEAQMRIFGNFRFLGGLIYKEFIKEYKPEGHLVNPFRIPAEWPKWRAMDLGASHPTVCLWAAISPNDTLYIYREHVSRKSSVKQDSEAIIAKSEGETYKKPVILDPSAWAITKANMISVGQQFQQCGLPCMPAVRTQKFGEQAGVQRIKRWLETRDERGVPKFLIFDTCGHLISEFRRWKTKTDNKNQPLGSDAYEDKNNDALDALRYLITTANPAYSMPAMRVLQSIDE